MSERSLSRTIFLGVSAVVVAGLVGAPLVVGDFVSSSAGSEAVLVQADPEDVPLLCAPGIFDEQALAQLDVSAIPVMGDAFVEEALVGGGVALRATGGSDPGVAVSVVAVTNPPGLSVSACGVPLNSLAVVGGSTAVGEDTLLVLSNPADRPVSVRVTGFVRGGSLGAAPPITVAAGTTFTWRPSVWFPDEKNLGLLIDADGSGVAAWLQSSGHRGEVPVGTAVLPASALAATVVLAGIPPGGEATLQLLNPAEDPVEVGVSVLSEEGKSALPGTDNLVLQSGVTELPLPDRTADLSALLVTAASGQPLSASVVVQTEGAEDPVVADQNVEARQFIGPSQMTGPVPTFPVGVISGLETFGVEGASVRVAYVTDRSVEILAVDEGGVAPDLPGNLLAAAWILEGEVLDGPVFAVVPVPQSAVESTAQLVTLGSP